MQKKKCQWFIVSSNPRDQPQGGVVVPVIAVVEHGQIFLRDVLRYVESVSLDQLLILCQLILKRKTTQASRERQELRLYQQYVVRVCVCVCVTHCAEVMSHNDVHQVAGPSTQLSQTKKTQHFWDMWLKVS